MKKAASTEKSRPKYPYANKPGSLRKFLGLIPTKPKPTKINDVLLKTWGFTDGNDYSIIRVLKALGLVAADNTPTADYTAFMHKGTGPAHLAVKIRQVYPDLFEASHAPHKEADLENLFNIHSGGGDSAMALQIQTFKALCDHADFSGTTPAAKGSGQQGTHGDGGNAGGKGAEPESVTIHIDLHIHLPENKARRDYEYMFEDIARYIYGRPTASQPPQTEGL